MGGEDDVPSAVASLICALTAGQSLGRSGGNFGWSHAFIHLNLTAHGIIGILHYQNSVFGMDTAKIFPVSLAAARFLSIAGLNADIYRFRHKLAPILFVASGLVPLYLEIVEKKQEELAMAVIVINLACLAYSALNTRNEYTWYSVAAGAVGCLIAPMAKINPLIPLALAAFDYCSFRCFFVISI